MIFVTAIFFSVLLASIFFGLELRGRRLRALKPATFGEVWTYSQKRGAPSPRYPALLFALMTLFLFQIWEAFLRFLLQRESHGVFFAMGLVCVVIAIALRQRRLLSLHEIDLRLGRLTLVLICVGFSALLNSWGTLVFIPWVYFRAMFLPNRLG